MTSRYRGMCKFSTRKCARGESWPAYYIRRKCWLFRFDRLIEVTLNKLLRKLWCLPRISHSSIVHCVAQIDTISAIVFSRFLSLLSSSLTSSSSLVQSVFCLSSQMMYSFSGYNNIFGSKHLVDYSSTDLCIADIVRKVRHLYGLNSPCEGLISYVTCS